MGVEVVNGGDGRVLVVEVVCADALALAAVLVVPIAHQGEVVGVDV